MPMRSGCVRSIREECLDRLILFGERRLRHVVDHFVAHYHGERNHQGLGNELILPQCDENSGTRVCCRERLGGLLRFTIVRPRHAWRAWQSLRTLRAMRRSEVS